MGHDLSLRAPTFIARATLQRNPRDLSSPFQQPNLAPRGQFGQDSECPTISPISAINSFTANCLLAFVPRSVSLNLH